MKNNLLLLFVLVLSACANAAFPELEDSSDIIASDSKNAMYENVEKQPVTPVVKEDTKPIEKKVALAAPKKEELKEPKPAVLVEAPKPKTPAIEVLKQTFYFRDGSSMLEGYSKEVRDIANFVKKHNAKVKVLGHSSSRTHDTDPVSHRMANFEASFNRAQNVKNALVKAGVKKDNILTEALSDSRPAYLEVMPEGERLNRRAEIYVIY